MKHHIDCKICNASYLATRNHCPVCGARLRFVVSETGKLRITYFDVVSRREMVRAFRSIASDVQESV